MFTLRYTHSTPGAEQVHIDSTTAFPFDLNKLIDFDAVFKERYDPSTYELYVGCGGCVTGDAYMKASRIAPDAYQSMVVEPFTATNYFSAFKEERRKFDPKKLIGCAEEHFTIRLRDFHNRTDADGNQINKPLVWGAVLGLGERFAWNEFFLFPTYILKNHGPSWNLHAWTWPFILVTVAVGYWFERWLRRWLLGSYWQLSPWHTQAGLHPRAWCCELAIVAFLSAATEGFAHSMLAWSYDTTANPVAAVSISLCPNALAIAIQYWIWSRTIYRRPVPLKDDAKPWTRDITHPNWFVAQLLLGIVYFFMLGAGLYIGPAFVILDALFRGAEASGWEAPYRNAEYDASHEDERGFVGFGLIVKGVVFALVGLQWPALWGGAVVNWWMLGTAIVETLCGVGVLVLLPRAPRALRPYRLNGVVQTVLFAPKALVTQTATIPLVSARQSRA